MPEALVWPGLVLLGIAVGAYGTLIGAGGGFVLTPALILLYPAFQPEVIAAISLGVVAANAVSGSVAYARQRRIDYHAGLLFAAATVPGAVAGAFATSLLPRDTFEALFAVLLLVVAVWLLLPRPARIVTTPPPRRFVRRLLTDVHDHTYFYAFDPLLGVALGLGIGVVASLFGVGGGIVYVPAMILLMRFPAYIATSTSTFTLMFTALTGAGVHLVAGRYGGVEAETAALAVGALLGAQLGAVISERLAGQQPLVVRLLSAALLLVGARQFVGAMT